MTAEDSKERSDAKDNSEPEKNESVQDKTSVFDPDLEDADIKETDIVFDCPFCGKSLAIDYRGAGLTIPCVDCGKNVQVPIPDGMELSDIDSTGEEQEMRILNLRRSLSASEQRISHLESEIEELNVRRQSLEKDRSDAIFRMGQVLDKAGVIQDSMKAISDALQQIMKIAGEKH